jgi:hypothetical protein
VQIALSCFRGLLFSWCSHESPLVLLRDTHCLRRRYRVDPVRHSECAAMSAVLALLAVYCFFLGLVEVAHKVGRAVSWVLRWRDR